MTPVCTPYTDRYTPCIRDTKAEIPSGELCWGNCSEILITKYEASPFKLLNFLIVKTDAFLTALKLLGVVAPDEWFSLVNLSLSYMCMCALLTFLFGGTTKS